MYKTEEVRVGTLKLLSERITEQREEIAHLKSINRCLRNRHDRELRQKDGPPGLEATARGHRAREKEDKTQRMAPAQFG